MTKKELETNPEVKELFKVATLELLATKNIESITIKEIAKKVGVNSGLIYYYFDSKAGLYKAAIASVIYKLLGKFRDISNQHTDSYELINAWFDLNETHSNELRMLLKIMINFRWSIDSKNKDNHYDELNSLIDLFYHNEENLILKTSIEAGIEKGIFRKVDAEQVARFVSIQLNGILISSYTRGITDIKSELDSTKNFLWNFLSYH